MLIISATYDLPQLFSWEVVETRRLTLRNGQPRFCELPLFRGSLTAAAAKVHELTQQGREVRGRVVGLLRPWTPETYAAYRNQRRRAQRAVQAYQGVAA